MGSLSQHDIKVCANLIRWDRDRPGSARIGQDPRREITTVLQATPFNNRGLRKSYFLLSWENPDHDWSWPIPADHDRWERPIINKTLSGRGGNSVVDLDLSLDLIIMKLQDVVEDEEDDRFTIKLIRSSLLDSNSRSLTLGRQTKKVNLDLHVLDTKPYRNTFPWTLSSEMCSRGYGF